MAKETKVEQTESTEQMVPLSVVEKLIAEVEALKAANKGLTGEDLKAILDAQNAALNDAQRKTLEAVTTPVKINRDHAGISVFSYPEGDVARPKPILQDASGKPRETYFCGRRENEDSLRPEEIDAYNAIQEDCSVRGGTWTARVFKDGSRPILKVDVPCRTVDDRMALPKGLVAILSELSTGTALDITDLHRQLSEMREKLSKFEQKSA